MPERLLVAVLFGGRSVEHDVSIRSARSVLSAIDRARHNVVPIAIDADGRWFTSPNPLGVNEPGADPGARRAVRLSPEPGAGLEVEGAEVRHPDCYLPLVHGAGGEDGTLQGLFELAGVAYVGAGPLASALAMDKAMCKKVLRQAGLPVLDNLVVSRPEWLRDREAVLRKVGGWHGGGTLFVKPSSGGSSVGVSRVEDPETLPEALETAFSLDLVALIEPAVDAREIEVSVLGNDEPQTSVPGEIIPARLFYDYRAKYEDDRTRLLVPAPVEASLADRLRELAVGAFRAIGACGLGRVDFLVDRATGTPWISELNTLPGFTDISMYPRLWEATGIPYPDLIDRLIALGREQHRRRGRLLRALHGEVFPQRMV